METQQRRTWAEVDLNALSHNYHIIRAMIPGHCRFLGLCKANGYGHGAVQVGIRLEELGCDMLAVACLEEGLELRRAGISCPILCLGYTAGEFAPLLLDYQITQMVEDLETGKALSAAAVRAGKRLNIHVKLDTGMTRLGFLWREETAARAVLDLAQLCKLPGLYPQGLFTHFADSSDREDYTMMQLTRFLEARERLNQEGISFEIYHCANSGAVLHYPCTHLDMVRPGLILYGYYPDGHSGILTPGPLLPVMKLKSRVTAVHAVPVGTSVSYGCTEVLQRDSRIALLPIGYGDGYSRLFSRGMEVLLHGKRCPIVGTVCMDMCMIDVTDVPEVERGDVALVYGEDCLVDEGAARAGTIPYELLCNVSPRVPRVYLGGKDKIHCQVPEC